MGKKIFIQVFILIGFLVIAASSATTQNTPKHTSSSSSYSSTDVGYLPSSTTAPSNSSESNSFLPAEPVEFPQPACKTCHGKKGYYAFDIWITCGRCGGTGKEPVH